MVFKKRMDNRLPMKTCRVFIAAIAVLLYCNAAISQAKLASLFTDNMVLQQQTDAPIWGWSSPGTNVRIQTSWDKRTYTAKAAPSGRWLVKVATPGAGGPYDITISDGSPLTLHNVLIGEVWLCGGQSNMEMPMKGFRGQPIIGSNDAILHSKNNKIRVYTVPRSSTLERQDNSKPSEWKIAGPEAISNFSATGYYFGRLLNEMLDVPVGLINDSYSGSYVQAWMSPGLLAGFDIKKPDSIKAVSRTPTTLYNGMLYPVAGYAIKGVIWYQGESNYDDPDLYEKLFPAMVKEWRSSWGQGDFPFYYAQIAPYDYAQLPPYRVGGKYNSAFLRDAQRKMEDRVPNAAMAVLMDIGEEKNIHPSDKEAGGKRLALLALAKTYGMKGFGAESPQYDSLMVSGGMANVRFKNAPNGLTAFVKELSQFEIAGANKIFYPAKAWINGNNVTVVAPEVKEPVAVRYAFKDFVVGDLFSTEGLPVSSFRTDDW